MLGAPARLMGSMAIAPPVSAIAGSAARAAVKSRRFMRRGYRTPESEKIREARAFDSASAGWADCQCDHPFLFPTDLHDDDTLVRGSDAHPPAAADHGGAAGRSRHGQAKATGH